MLSQYEKNNSFRREKIETYESLFFSTTIVLEIWRFYLDRLFLLDVAQLLLLLL